MYVRLAETPDLPAILDISNWAAINTAANFAIEPETLESWRQSFEQTHAMYPWLVAEVTDSRPRHEAAIIGFAKTSPHKGRCAYAWTAEISVYVHPKYHRRGVGKALYQRLIPLLKAQGYVTLIAGITIPNAASQHLHESFGFKRVATFERVGWKFNAWHDVGYWELLLQNGDFVPTSIRPVISTGIPLTLPSSGERRGTL